MAASASRRDSRRDGDDRPETLDELLDEARIQLNEVPRFGRQHGGARSKLWCPECGGGREKEKNFHVLIDPDGKGATWHCFRANNCGFSGGGRIRNAPRLGTEQRTPKMYRRPPPPRNPELPQSTIDYFDKFGVSLATLEAFGVYRTIRRMPVLDADGKQTNDRRDIPVIAYPYREDGEVVNVKYKALYPRGDRIVKRFSQEAEAKPSLFNIEASPTPTSTALSSRARTMSWC